MRKLLSLLVALAVLAMPFTMAEAGSKTPYPAAYRTTSKPTVCLTFDDGNPRASVETIINILHAKGVKCTFFVIGSQLIRHADLWRKAVEYGNEIAYHSMKHTYMTRKNNAFLQNDINQWNATAKAVLGAGYKIPGVLRLPGGSGYKTARIMNLIGSLGYKAISWNLDTMSGVTAKSKRNTNARIKNYILKHTKAGSIVLMHFDKYNAKALPYYIDALKAKYTLGTVSDALGLTPPPPPPPTPTPVPTPTPSPTPTPTPLVPTPTPSPAPTPTPPVPTMEPTPAPADVQVQSKGPTPLVSPAPNETAVQPEPFATVPGAPGQESPGTPDPGAD